MGKQPWFRILDLYIVINSCVTGICNVVGFLIIAPQSDANNFSDMYRIKILKKCKTENIFRWMLFALVTCVLTIVMWHVMFLQYNFSLCISIAHTSVSYLVFFIIIGTMPVCIPARSKILFPKISRISLNMGCV